MLHWFFRSLSEEANKILLRKNVKDTSSFTVRLFNGSTLSKLDAIAEKAGYTRNELVNIVLEKFTNEAEVVGADEDREESMHYFRTLDQHLYATLGKEVLIGITNEEVGHEKKKYILNDYKLSYKHNSLYLELERNGDQYPITFHKVYDIRHVYAGERLKTWLYMEPNNWRFYLYYDKEKLNDLPGNFRSQKYEE